MKLKIVRFLLIYWLWHLDFTPLFRWNVKQVFAYLVVKYENSEFIRNEIVLWDRIIQQEDLHVIEEDSLSSEYTLADIKEHLGYFNFYITSSY